MSLASRFRASHGGIHSAFRSRMVFLANGGTSSSSTAGFATQRDPPMPPLTNPVEQAIAAAQQRGDLNNLSGAGKPLSKTSSSSTAAVAGMSSTELLSKKAEFEMRRAIQSGELDHLQGEKLEYRGTNIVSVSLSAKSSSGGGGGEPTGAKIMERYILKQAQPKAKDLK